MSWPGRLSYVNPKHINVQIPWELITASNPARRGQAIIIYANGLGVVGNQPASGEAGPVRPLASTLVTPTVTIGGAAAQVLFSGLTPGSIGLCQVDVLVPQVLPLA